MTTRHDLFTRVRKAMQDIDLGAGIDLEPDVWNDMAYAAIEAVINTIGDHQLAGMIGDTGEKPSRVLVESLTDTHGADTIEMLQDDDEERAQ